MIKKIYAIKFYILLIFLLFFIGIYFIYSILEKSDFHFAFSLSFLIINIAIFFLEIQTVTINYETKTLKYHTLQNMNINKISIDEWNYNIFLSDVVKIEIVNLTKKEKLKYLGKNHLFHKFLKIQVGNNRYKFFNISMFSKIQINKIIGFCRPESREN